MKRRWIAESLALLVLAVVLLAVGERLKDAAGPAGFTLLGAAVVRGLDGFSHQRERAAEEEAARRRDLDESRRLLYMALATMHGTYEGRAEIAGTVANALAHHSKLLSRTRAESLASWIVSASGAPTDLAAIVRAEIDRITDLLGDHAPED